MATAVDVLAGIRLRRGGAITLTFGKKLTTETMFGFFKKKQSPPSQQDPPEDAQSFLDGVRSFASGDMNDLETMIFRAKSGMEVPQTVLLQKMLGSDGYILAVSEAELNQCARLRDPESGEARLAVFTSERMAIQAIEQRPGPYKHIAKMPFPIIISACGTDVGLAVNPFSDQLIFEVSAESLREVRNLIAKAEQGGAH